MKAWQDEVARRLRGSAPQPPVPADWPFPPVASEAAWHAARNELGTSLEELASIVSTLTAADLEPMVGATRDAALGSGVSRAEMLVGVLQHNAYHAGQIALLAKAIRDKLQDPID